MRPVRAAVPVLALGLVLSACSSGDPVDDGAPEASASPLDGVSDGATDGAADDASADPSASDTEEPRDPTDTDRARFVADYRPDGASDLEHVAVDVDNDGIDEVVFSYVRGGEGVAHVDLAVWQGTAYEVVAGGDGGVADRVDRVSVADINGDGLVEVALFHSTGSSGAGATIWAVDATRLVPLVASEGCADGSATYGVIGAEIEDRDQDGIAEIYATCDDSPLPVAAWSTDGYRWENGQYRFDASL